LRQRILAKQAGRSRAGSSTQGAADKAAAADLLVFIRHCQVPSLFSPSNYSPSSATTELPGIEKFHKHARLWRRIQVFEASKML
jgi:hypothetical protein